MSDGMTQDAADERRYALLAARSMDAASVRAAPVSPVVGELEVELVRRADAATRARAVASRMPEDYLTAEDRGVFRERLAEYTKRLAHPKWARYELVVPGFGRDASPGCLPYGCCFLWPHDWRVQVWPGVHAEPDSEGPTLERFAAGDGYVRDWLDGEERRVSAAIASWSTWFGLPLEATLHLIAPGRQKPGSWGGFRLAPGMRMGVVAGHFRAFLERAK